MCYRIEIVFKELRSAFIVANFKKGFSWIAVTENEKGLCYTITLAYSVFTATS